MRRYLRELGFNFDDDELDPIVSLLAGAQRQRVEAASAIVNTVTRSTAIVALAEIEPKIAQMMEAAGLDWRGFREKVRLGGDITPLEVDDVDLHEDFERALALFAENHPDRLVPTPANFAAAIVEMVAPAPKAGVLGSRFQEFGADLALLPSVIHSLDPGWKGKVSSLVARILYANSENPEARGTGIVISPRHIVTSADLLDYGSERTPPFDVHLDLPMIAPGQRIVARCIRRTPIDAETSDANFIIPHIAVIELPTEHPDLVPELPRLTDPGGQFDGPVILFGYSPDMNNGAWVTGLLHTMAANDQLLEFEESLPSGFSGAPVWLPDGAGTLGMVIGAGVSGSTVVSANVLSEATAGIEPAPWWRGKSDDEDDTVSNRGPGDTQSVWVTSGNPRLNPNARLRERSVGETLRWQVPAGVREGDYLFMWVTGGTGFQYVLKALGDPEPDTFQSKPGQFTSLQVSARLEQPVGMKALRSVPVLEDWPLVKSNMQGAMARQTEGIENDTRVWTALKTIIIQQNPDVQDLLDEIETQILEPNRPTPSLEPDSQTSVRRDDAERDHDALGRAPLAVSLAWTLHEIWCTEQGLDPFPRRKPQRDAAGFVAHIDAPWGGGKTSFANLIARTLDPNLDDKVPEFLSTLYPERTDMSGLFIPACHETGRLKTDKGRHYIWDRRARRPWIIVPFNAWLNQHVDPPWWSFYQTIRKACFAAILKDGVPTVHQEDDGRYRTKKESGLNRLDRMRGLWLRELWWRFWTPKVRNSVLILLLVVAASLVLRQFDLFDLKTLQESFLGDSGWSLSTLISTTVMVVLGGASALWSLFAAFTQSLLPGTPEAARNYSLGSSDPFARFRQHFARMMEQIERPILVIIDDIDRCEPQFIVEMTRGLQTILKSPRLVYLLLGDRNWIEQAFEVCHEDMNDIDVGPEHTFGGRFVEKAIQLSFVLPGIGEHKEDYVREVLIGRTILDQRHTRRSGAPVLSNQEPQADVTIDDDAMLGRGAVERDEDGVVEISADQRRALRDRISEAASASEIDETAVGAFDAAAGTTPGQKRAYQRAVREEVVLRRAAQKEEVEQAIRHRLQPLARFLPGNPRHIKRIINAVSMYQNSILLTEEDLGDAKFGGPLWRQLVIGVVLMVGYPKSWSYLAKNPEWADALVAGEKRPGGGSGTDTELHGVYRDLRENADFVDLLSKAELRDRATGAATKTVITAEVIRWLNRVIPIAAG